jgi:CBS domain-containing protein
MALDAEKYNYITSLDSTIEEAWSKIESNRHRSIIVTDENKVVGTLSDGDIRKAILAGRLLSTQVKEIMNTNFVSITEDKKDKSLSIMQQKDIFIIPIVDSQMTLLDIVVK